VGLRLHLIYGIALVMAISAVAQARDFEMGGDADYTIMAPEPGTPGAKAHTRAGTKDARASAKPDRASVKAEQAHHPSLLGREMFIAKLHRGPNMFFATRGSPGVVLPTPLPRTRLIPPEGGGRLTLPSFPQEQGPTVVPGMTATVPNLPHGAETFQDRASRCTFQSSLYGVPGNARTQYMGACVQ
jgi:hypothetical protein